jgi:DNA polymerase-3 subunit gamma/tau
VTDELPLTLKYRPRRFADIVGQQAPRLVLQRMITTDSIRPALLFHGAYGNGKTSTARVLAAALNCEKDDPAARPCGGCATCEAVSAGRSADVTEVDAASSGLVEHRSRAIESVCWMKSMS